MATAFDTNRDVRKFIPWLKSQGFTTAIRYYTALASPKRMTRAEAEALVRGGLKLASVYQDRGNAAADFDADRGRTAGTRALNYAMQEIGQPLGTAIYFSVDFDASAKEIREHIVPHFQAIRTALVEPGQGGPAYRVGAYGSGLVLRTLLDAGLIELSWLSMSMGFRESLAFHQAGTWNLHQHLEIRNAATPVGPLSYDPDEVGVGGCGEFTLELADSTPAVAPRYRVNARSGLLLRTGPGKDFERITSLPAGRELGVLSHHGEWALVDLEGDGQADGYCHAGFLVAVAG